MKVSNILLVVAPVFVAAAIAPAGPQVEMLTINSSGEQGNAAGCPTSGVPAIARDGRYVAFVSLVPTYVAADLNGTGDVFVRDRLAGTTERVSISSSGQEGDGFSGFNFDDSKHSSTISLSADGRFVAFTSAATNLVTGDTNGVFDIFVRDRVMGTTERVSVSTGSGQADGFSTSCTVTPDGRYIIFDSVAENLVAGDTNQRRDIFRRDRILNLTERVSLSNAGAEPNGDCSDPAVSDDGRFVVFVSGATNLVAGPTPAYVRGVFLRDMLAGATEFIGISCYDSKGCENRGFGHPAISADGDIIAFREAIESGFQHITISDRGSGTTTVINQDANCDVDRVVSLSADGRCVGFSSRATNLVPGDTNATWDAFVHDRIAETNTRVSVDSMGGEMLGDGIGDICALSGNGLVAVFSTAAGNLVTDDTNGRGDIFAHDLATGATQRMSVSSFGAEGTTETCVASGVLDLTPDGRYAVLSTVSTNMLPGIHPSDSEPSLAIRDRATGETFGPSQDGDCAGPRTVIATAAAISANGQRIAFTSPEQNLVPNDTNGALDIFLWDRPSGTISRVSVSSTGQEHHGDPSGFTDSPSISADGMRIAFHSNAPDLSPADGNAWEDVYMRDTTTGLTRLVSTPGNDASYGAAISADGLVIAFVSQANNLVPGDTNGAADIFVRVLSESGFTCVSVSSGGAQADAGSVTSEHQDSVAISADGRFIAFPSIASNLVNGDTNSASDIFVRDTVLATTERISLATSGAQANAPSHGAAISPDGRFVAFQSDATNLVPTDTNGLTDSFVHDRVTGRTIRVSTTLGGAQGNGPSVSEFPLPQHAVSEDGGLVAFSSFADNLVAGDTNNASDGFLRATIFACEGDADSNRQVGLGDVAVMINNWSFQVEPGTNGDLSADGVVGLADLAVTINHWSMSCP